MSAPRKYLLELRATAARLVNEALAEEPQVSLNAAVLQIGPQVRIATDMLRIWSKQGRVDQGLSPRATTSDVARINGT